MNISPQYAKTLRIGILTQFLMFILTPVFDYWQTFILLFGQPMGMWLVSIISYYIIMLWIVLKRPNNPTTSDILFLSFGYILLFIIATILTPCIWKIIGESSLPGCQRLFQR